MKIIPSPSKKNLVKFKFDQQILNILTPPPPPKWIDHIQEHLDTFDTDDNYPNYKKAFIPAGCVPAACQPNMPRRCPPDVSTSGDGACTVRSNQPGLQR